MQRQGFGQEGQGNTNPGNVFGSASHASGLRVVQTRCRRILFVTKDPEFSRGALEFANMRRVPVRVADFGSALGEVERSEKRGLVVVVDFADFEWGLMVRKQAAERGVHVIALANPSPTESQQKRLDETDAGPAFFIRTFDGGRDAGHYLDLVLHYR